MPKLGFAIFREGYEGNATDLVAPKSDYPSVSDFVRTCEIEGKGYPWFDRIKSENVRVAYCRYYPKAPEDCHIKGGCYTFSPPGRGAFPVWRINLEDTQGEGGR